MTHLSNNVSLTPTMVTQDQLESFFEYFATPIHDSTSEPVSSAALAAFDRTSTAGVSQNGHIADGTQLDGDGSGMAPITQLDTLEHVSSLAENGLASSYPQSSGINGCPSDSVWSFGLDDWFSEQPPTANRLPYNNLPTPSMSGLPSYIPQPSIMNHFEYYNLPWPHVGNFGCCPHWCPNAFDIAVQKAALNLLLDSLAIPRGQLPTSQDTRPDAAIGLESAPLSMDEQLQTCDEAALGFEATATTQEAFSWESGDASNQGSKRKRKCEEVVPSPALSSNSICGDKGRSSKSAVEDLKAEQKDEHNYHYRDDNRGLDCQRHNGETHDAKQVPRLDATARRETAFVRIDKVAFKRHIEVMGEAYDHSFIEETSWKWNRRDNVYKSDKSSCFDLEPLQLKELYDAQGPQNFTIQIQTSLRESLVLRKNVDYFYGESSITGGKYKISQEELGKLLSTPHQSSNVDFQDNKRRRIHR